MVVYPSPKDRIFIAKRELLINEKPANCLLSRHSSHGGVPASHFLAVILPFNRRPRYLPPESSPPASTCAPDSHNRELVFLPCHVKRAVADLLPNRKPCHLVFLTAPKTRCHFDRRRRTLPPERRACPERSRMESASLLMPHPSPEAFVFNWQLIAQAHSSQLTAHSSQLETRKRLCFQPHQTILREFPQQNRMSSSHSPLKSN